MDIKVLGSSSKGNCYLLNEDLMLDAGVIIKDIIKNIKNINDIKAVCITHEHLDHSKAVHELIKRGVQVYISKGTCEALGLNTQAYNVNIIECLKQFKVGKYTILPFDVEHDAKEPLGFLVYNSITKEKLLFATDTYSIKYKFNDVNYFLIECNYSQKILKEKEINRSLLKRIWNSHFSLENLIDFLSKNNLEKCSEIILIHLSDSNSNEKFFIDEVKNNFGINTIAAKKGDMFELKKIN